MFGELTPNQVCDLNEKYPCLKILGYPIWSSCETWGWECIWRHEYRLPKAERTNPDLYGVLPEKERLTLDKKLKDHRIWGLFDLAEIYCNN